MQLSPMIGLYSPAPGSGKSTLATALEVYGFRTLKFAGPLKAMLRGLLREAGCPDHKVERMVEGDLKEEPSPYLSGRTPRYTMQRLGTEFGRGMIADAFWVDTFMRRADTIRRTFPVVCDDVRFPNEMEAIRAAGGLLVRVTRPGLTATSGHVSEGGLDGFAFDLEVTNDSACAAQFGLIWAPILEAVAYGRPVLCGPSL